MAGDLLRLRVRCDPHAPGVVRSALADLQELGWMLGDAMLVASELVTNAVRHSGCSEDDDLSISVKAEECIRVEVTDPGRIGSSAEIAHRDVGFGGLGLRVVQELAGAWGAERRPEGYLVWAELSAPLADEDADHGWSRESGSEAHSVTDL